MTKRSAAAIFALLLLTMVTSCGPSQPVPIRRSGDDREAVSGVEQLRIAVDLLRQLDNIESNEGMMKIAYHLNRWSESEVGQFDWRPDPMVEELPPEYQNLPPMKRLAAKSFQREDIQFLREAYWLSGIAKWVTRIDADSTFEDWLAGIEQNDPRTAEELAITLRLFDWTIRNIQLEPTAQPTGASTSDQGPPPWEQGIAGPGYRDFPWQTLLFGHGDAYQRARVFILLLRQYEIDAVMLAFDDQPDAGQSQLWLPAVLIDGQLYLFDTQLGLPIPGPGGKGVATLSEVSDDRGLLQRLELGAEYRYPAARADMTKLLALIDASPEYLSRRMARLESELASDDRLLLSVLPSKMAERITAANKSIQRVELWHVPFRNWIYRQALDERVRKDPDEMRARLRREMVFESLNSLVRGRQLHFLGRFDNEGERPGAKKHYVDARVPDDLLEQIETSPDVQEQLGIIKGRENEQQWAARLQLEKYLRRQSKQNSSYWLGLIHYDTGNYDAAADWFNKRTLETEENPWRSGASYNLARVYEQNDKLEEARRLLLITQSPQRHGNLLRARELKERLESQSD